MSTKSNSKLDGRARSIYCTANYRNTRRQQVNKSTNSIAVPYIYLLTRCFRKIVELSVLSLVFREDMTTIPPSVFLNKR